MARNEQFQRYVEAGTAFLGMSQQRAEAIVKDWVNSGEVARSQAQKVVEWLLERSQKGTEELVSVVRREVKAQVEALGLATKDDIARLEAKLEGMRAPASRTRGPGTRAARTATVAPAAESRRASKAAPITKAASRKRRPTASESGEG